jgi:site-specific DNA recombinase
MSAASTLRCAIYTRVSSDQGLEQDFNSLDAQREAAEAYIKSQAHEGWRLRRDRYDDGGFSGGSMERPALQKLLCDVAERRIDIIVVYKVDRLTRSLADFAKLVELFDSKGVSFVSVTQSFNTTTSMGRLTLNVLLSFAQFEREVTGERIRDKIAASKKKGIWMGGVVPLGYRVENRKLLVDEREAETVRRIFERYLELGSIPALQRDLRDRGIRSRARVLASGENLGDVPLTNGPLSHLLKNRMYLGELNHRGASYKGEHPAIVSVELFEAVQAKLAANLNRRDLRKGRSHALLTGCLFDDRNNLMSPTHAVKKGVRYRYYVSTALVQGREADAGSVARVPAKEIEALVRDGLREHIAEAAIEANVDADLCKQIGLRVTLRSGSLEMTWIETEASDDHTSDDRRRIDIPYIFSPHKRRREIIMPTNASHYVRPIRGEDQRNLTRSIALGRMWLQEILGGTSIQTIASREHKSDRMIRMMLTLAFLDPTLVRAALHGTLPRGISTRRLIDAPMLWHQQWQEIGLSRPT